MINVYFFAQAGQPVEVLYSIACIGQDNHVIAFSLLVAGGACLVFCFLLVDFFFNPFNQDNDIKCLYKNPRSLLMTSSGENILG
jgi:hypothetical protein